MRKKSTKSASYSASPAKPQETDENGAISFRSPQRDKDTNVKVADSDQMISPPVASGSPKKSRASKKTNTPRKKNSEFDDMEVSAPVLVTSTSPTRHKGTVKRTDKDSSSSDSGESPVKNQRGEKKGGISGTSQNRNPRQSLIMDVDMGNLGYIGAEEKLSDLFAEIESGLQLQRPGYSATPTQSSNPEWANFLS